jgi:NADP-dependent 3-hydroxy acid dehydrogenase YdfG
MSGIEDKVVAITGASSGIGEATALLLSERGAKVVLGARRSDRLKIVADRIGRAGGEAAYVPTMSVYSGTKFAVRAISEGLRQEAGDKLRVTIISPGFVRTNFAETVRNPDMKAQLAESRDKFALPPNAIARAIAFAIEQPARC